MKLATKIIALAALAMTAVTIYQIHHLTVVSAEQQKEIDALSVLVDQSAEETAKLLAK